MSKFIISILFLILAGEVIILLLMQKERPQEKVLAESTIATPISTVLPTLTSEPNPTNTPTAKPTAKPTITPVPFVSPKLLAEAEQPTSSSQQINEFIDRFAGQYGVDPNVIRHMALCESGFRPNAKNYIYRGLFQFGPITWQNIRKEMGEDTNIDLRANAEEAVQTTAYALSKGKTGLWPNCSP